MLRVLGILLAAALIAALLFGACVSACGVALVSVVAEGSPEATRFTAPVPLLLPLAALRFAPDHLLPHYLGEEELDEFGAPALAALNATLEALKAAPDAVLVEITDGEDLLLRVAKADEDLVIRVREGGEAGSRVFVRTPLRALDEAAGACEEVEGSSRIRCDARELALSLIALARGAEVEVQDAETRVSLSVW